jgi:hypothetical protein
LKEYQHTSEFTPKHYIFVCIITLQVRKKKSEQKRSTFDAGRYNRR